MQDIDRKEPTPIRKTPPSLFEQWGMLEKIETELRDRIRRERADIKAEYERKRTEILNEYTGRIEEEVAKLEKLRDAELAQLGEVTMEKIRAHEILAGRMARNAK